MTEIIDTLTIIRGDDTTFDVAFTDANGDAVDITGATVFFTIKASPSDVDADALATKTVTSHTNAVGGLTQIALTTAQTTAMDPGTYYWDLQIKDATNRISSTMAGRVKVLADITQRTT